MSDKEHVYRGKDIVVRYDLARCLHSAECLRALPGVFDTRGRPWVQPDGAPADEVAHVVTRCPSGALHFERNDGVPAEGVPERNTIRVVAEGPLYLRGDIEVVDGEGRQLRRDTRLALCRCGASSRKPFCDNSHLRVGFDDAGELPDRLFAEVQPAASGPLTITVRANGSLRCEGSAEIIAAGGEARPAPASFSLCRCGASERKPACDGSHRRVGFVAE